MTLAFSSGEGGGRNTTSKLYENVGTSYAIIQFCDLYSLIRLPKNKLLVRLFLTIEPEF